MMIEAAKSVCADNFIRTMPGGYDMMLSKGAENISQGQRQLLTIARAIISDPEIMILDEATSNVDAHTEQTIQNAILYIMVVLTAIRCIFTQNYESLATCVLVLILFLVPALVEDRMKLSIPPLFEAIIFAFIFAAEILGEVDNYYTKIPGWDTILHTMNGFLFAAVGFSMIYLLNRGSKNFNLTPLYNSNNYLMEELYNIWKHMAIPNNHFFGRNSPGSHSHRAGDLV